MWVECLFGIFGEKGLWMVNDPKKWNLGRFSCYMYLFYADNNFENIHRGDYVEISIKFSPFFDKINEEKVGHFLNFKYICKPMNISRGRKYFTSRGINLGGVLARL